MDPWTEVLILYKGDFMGRLALPWRIQYVSSFAPNFN
jgi:hypothetical protein